MVRFWFCEGVGFVGSSVVEEGVDMVVAVFSGEKEEVPEVIR